MIDTTITNAARRLSHATNARTAREERSARRMAAMEAAMREQQEQNARPFYTEELREVLAVYLRNMETLISDLRHVIDVGGPAVDLRSLVERARAAEGGLSWMVSSAAERAGLVAVAAEG